VLAYLLLEAWHVPEVAYNWLCFSFVKGNNRAFISREWLKMWMSLISSQLVIFFRPNITRIDLRASCSGCGADSRGDDFCRWDIELPFKQSPSGGCRAEFIL